MSRKHRSEGHPTGHTHSEQYLAKARSIDGREWEAPHPYIVGIRVLWRGVRLTCTLPHYAGHQAEHPWDPGDGWAIEKNAAMWAPDWRDQEERLRGVVATLLDLAAIHRPPTGGEREWSFARRHAHRLGEIVAEITRVSMQ